MKRVLTLLFLLLSSLCFAQHVSFLGISLGKDINTFEKDIRAKGFSFIMESPFAGKQYRGDFWKFDDCSLFITEDEGKATSVEIVQSGVAYLFDELVRELDKKYGRHKVIEDYFSGWPDGYIWIVSGGYVMAYNQLSILHVNYLDRTSFWVKKEDASKRNRANDL